MNELPKVDIVIATIGRSTLDTSITAALNQTYPNVRCVVVGDGPQPKAKAIASRYGKRVLYLETPKPLRRAGNGAKEFWYTHKECAPFFRYLDDDDWLPPHSIACQVAPLLTSDAVMSVCKMWMVVWEGSVVHKERSLSGELKVGQVGNGSVLVRKSIVQDIHYEDGVYSDFFWIRTLSTLGDMIRVPHHLYWYNQERLHGSEEARLHERVVIDVNHS